MDFFKKNKHLMTAVCAAASLAVAGIAGKDFYDFRHYQEVIMPGPGVTRTFMLSDYNENLKGTFGDTTVYVLEGEQEGGSFLILGGTHPNEPSGHMAAMTIVESGRVEAGTLYVIPRTDNSAFTHNDPQEGSPHFFHIDTKSGTREFVFGSRASNPSDQGPDPDVYTHSSGQTLSGSEMRNINRTYPGVKDGTMTEQISYAITNMINTLDIDMEMDLHEASPEYPTINATVAHERAMSMASMGILELQMAGVDMSLEPSPVSLHGLTHRELGDHTNTLALLMETGNPSQGRLHGKTSEDLILTGKDDYYMKAAAAGYLYIPYDENGAPLEMRVGRHLQGVQEYIRAFTDMYGAEKGEIVVSGLPSYEALTSGGYKLGEYLN